ncbi:hypothetical protein PGTUg99_013899 [Puccinia graminis f. sp. tritici]|uniref:Uncharacterized protein n=1 Tax=Puccinia graminis f. sp. tritici TaxID=56615 RepID=A0A5B0M2F3_PUCGR|nr:hypothetical protein PGTUg99_013899 [Puccinia graminis f. sp. tritici]
MLNPHASVFSNRSIAGPTSCHHSHTTLDQLPPRPHVSNSQLFFRFIKQVRKIMFNFIKQVFFMSLVSDQARLTLLTLPQIGEESVFELPDLNLPYPDESPLQSFYSSKNSHVDGLDPVLKQAMLHCEEIPHSSTSTTHDYSASSLKRKTNNLDTSLAAKEARIVPKKRPKAISNDQRESKPRDNREIVDQGSTSNFGALNIHHTRIENLKDALSPQKTMT